jgi:cytochrome o ubiquinol oxidase operon protein cyoD
MMEEHAKQHGDAPRNWGQTRNSTMPPKFESDPNFAGSFVSYTAGLVFALLLTGTSFIVSQTGLLWEPGVPAGLAVLAIAQMGVHLVFFLHIGTGPDNTNTVLALAFGILIVALVVSGSLWIMANLNANMMSPSDLIQMQR